MSMWVSTCLRILFLSPEVFPQLVHSKLPFRPRCIIDSSRDAKSKRKVIRVWAWLHYYWDAWYTSNHAIAKEVNKFSLFISQINGLKSSVFIFSLLSKETELHLDAAGYSGGQECFWSWSSFHKQCTDGTYPDEFQHVVLPCFSRKKLSHKWYKYTSHFRCWTFWSSTRSLHSNLKQSFQCQNENHAPNTGSITLTKIHSCKLPLPILQCLFPHLLIHFTSPWSMVQSLHFYAVVCSDVQGYSWF